MNFLTDDDRNRLIFNGRIRRDAAMARPDVEIDFFPVVKLFTPDAGCTWLLTEIDPEDPDIAFGLCDLGFGCPELGYVSLRELADARGGLGLPIERDLHFRPEGSLSSYAAQARSSGRIVA